MIRRFKNRKFENFSWADFSESELALKINKAIRLSEYFSSYSAVDDIVD